MITVRLKQRILITIFAECIFDYCAPYACIYSECIVFADSVD